jgi:hypothetical protein
MFTHPDLASQLAREHRRQMLADAARRQRRHQQRHQATRTANLAGTITGRLATALAGPGRADMPTPAAASPAGARQLGQRRYRHG